MSPKLGCATSSFPETNTTSRPNLKIESCSHYFSINTDMSGQEIKEDTVLVILGASGDLAGKKLVRSSER